jgi:hypothetical protein
MLGKVMTIKALLAVFAVSLALAGCGGTEGAVSQPVTSGPGATSEPTTSTLATSSEASAGPCRAADMLPVLRDRIGSHIVGAEIVRCRNGYGRVNALPDMSVCPPTCYETYEVYVHWTGTRWRVVDFGTGIECEDTTSLPPLPVPLSRACRALGYRQPTILRTRTFQMPSGNIGCALIQGVLRCDILSGLEPEPTRRCDLGWVGLVLARTGPAKPNCAGDTVYDSAAPRLDYGEMWNQGGFWCESQPDGLLCTNPESVRGSFHLSRQSWESG